MSPRPYSPAGSGSTIPSSTGRGAPLPGSLPGWVRMRPPAAPLRRPPSAGDAPGPATAAGPAPPERTDAAARAPQPEGANPSPPDPDAPTFSVIIPSRDEGELLRRTVRSVLQSEGPSFEVVVVDDGGGEAPALDEREPGVRLIRGPRLGVAQARNAGAEVARGRFFVFIDAHVLVPPRWLAELEDGFAADADVAALGPGIADEGRPEAVGFGQTWDAELNVTWLPRPGEAMAEVPLLPGGCVAVRREVFVGCGGFDRAFRGYGYDDVELSLRLWLLGHRLACLSGVVVLHRFRPSFPYPVDVGEHCYNLLRMAAIHFNEQRVGKVIAQVSRRIDPSLLLARLLTDGTAEERRRWHQTRVRSDDWFMSHFRIPF